MRPPRSARRGPLAALTALVVAGGTVVVLLPAPAQADSLVAEGEVGVEGTSSVVTCTGEDDAAKQFGVLASGTQTKNVAVEGTITDSADLADVSEWSASVRTTVTSRTGNDPSLAVTGTIAASVDAVQGDSSDCDVEASAGTTTFALMDLDSAGWVDLSLVHPAGTVGAVVLTDSSTMQIIYQSFAEESFRGSVWVGSGLYQLQMVVQGNVDDDSTTDSVPSSISGALKISATYRSAGAATAGPAGPGKPFLTLGDGVNCTDRQVLGIFTKKANTLKSATFLVNGKKQRTVTNPSAGDAVVLKTGSPTSATKVQAVLQTPTKKVTVSRSYLACE